MKIGFVSSHAFSYPGGVQKHTLALKKEFEKRKHEVKLILPRDTLSPPDFLTRFREKRDFSLKKDRDIIFFGGALYAPGNASKINLSLNITPLSVWRRLKKEKFDLLHFQNFGVFLPIQVLEAASQLRSPPLKILTLHAFWDASLLFREVPTLIDILNTFILPKFDGVIGVSRPVLSQIKYRGPKEVIPNGIDLNFFSPKGPKIKKFSRTKFALNILFVGRIEKRKGLIYLLKAFEILKKKHDSSVRVDSRKRNLRLIVVGEGEKRVEMENFVRKHKILDVFFEGEVEEEDLLKYYRTADICCFPSIYGEAFGIVLLEAMASERPVVAFANRGYKEVLTGEGSTFLVGPKDINGLVKKLDILIKSNRQRQKMGKWGRKEAEKYSWEKITDKTLVFYEKVIKSKSSY